ncbi:hypothetical protein [Okeania sp. SIO2G5]|uniref:hypothetical protein n=1 Tax=Okeania sp. SIO2G5 TaxID=2607796 RepID=UPI0013BEB90D|nr:hypothetical protein [Okeania sp. SIO2G5]NEP76295.1 hypothetical protein [Okeania sp. SIO2G5]
MIYRGLTAQPSEMAETVETGLQGKFLGQPFPIKSINTPAKRAYKLMHYRGVMY